MKGCSKAGKLLIGHLIFNLNLHKFNWSQTILFRFENAFIEFDYYSKHTHTKNETHCYPWNGLWLAV